MRLGDADFGIGPEGGVAFVDGVAWLTYVCCVWRRDGVCEEAEATRLKLPPRIGDAVRAGEELGPLMDRLTGIPNIGQGTGAVGVLTGDVIPRDDYLRPALAAALAPFLHSEWYGVAPLGAPEVRSRTMPNVPRKPQA